MVDMKGKFILLNTNEEIIKKIEEMKQKNTVKISLKKQFFSEHYVLTLSGKVDSSYTILNFLEMIEHCSLFKKGNMEMYSYGYPWSELFFIEKGAVYYQKLSPNSEKKKLVS